jgi:hypothetical protein
MRRQCTRPLAVPLDLVLLRACLGYHSFVCGSVEDVVVVDFFGEHFGNGCEAAILDI